MVLMTPAVVHIRELQRLELLDAAARERLTAAGMRPGSSHLRWQLSGIDLLDVWRRCALRARRTGRDSLSLASRIVGRSRTHASA